MKSSRQHHRLKLVPQVAPGTKGFIKSKLKSVWTPVQWLETEPNPNIKVPAEFSRAEHGEDSTPGAIVIASHSVKL